MVGGEDRIEVRLELPEAVLEEESAISNQDYVLGEATPLPPDPNAMEARFVGAVTLVAVVTISILAERILHFALARRGQGVLVDLREIPARVTNVAGIPQGFVLIVDANGTSKLEANSAPSALAAILRNSLRIG